MKRLICLFLTVIILVCIAGNAWMDAGRFLSEQEPTKNQGAVIDAAALDALREYNGGSVPDISVREDGVPYIIHGAYTDRKVTDEESAVASMADLSGLMNFSDTKDSFEATQVNRIDNNVYYRLQRCYGQYPVYGQEFIVTTDDTGNILSLSSGYSPITDCADKILITEEQAKTIAAEHSGSSFEGGTLMFYLPDSSSSARLAWQFSGLDVVFVDAGTGEILTSFPAIYIAYYEAAGVGIPDEDIYREVEINLARDDHDTEDASDDSYLFYDHSRNTYYYDAHHTQLNMNTYRETCDLLSSNDQVFGDQPQNEKKAVSLYENLSAVYDLYKDHVGITSYDNNGGLIIAVVDENSYNGYSAFSSFPGLRYDQMTTFLAFGSNVEYHKQIDVVGHEFTHSVQASVISGLNYSGETGALMEAYSDAMGELIELHSTGTVDWYMSDLRNLADPTQSGTGLPSVYKGEYWDPGEEVHHNSTVISHALYEMYSNGLCSGEDMAKFLYKAWQHMTPTGDFQQYSNCLFLAAAEMRMKQEQLTIIRTALKEAGIKDDRTVYVTFELRDAVTNKMLKHQDGSAITEVLVGLDLDYALTDKAYDVLSKDLAINVYLNDDDSFQTFNYAFSYGLWDVSIFAEGYELKTFSLVVDDTTERIQTLEMYPYAEKDDTPETGTDSPVIVDDAVYLDYLESGAYRSFFEEKPVETTYAYALLDIDQNGIRELVIQESTGDPLGWTTILVVQYDSMANDFMAVSWGPDGLNTSEGGNIAHVFRGVAYSAKYKCLAFSPLSYGEFFDQREYWCIDENQMSRSLYIGKDHSNANDKHWTAYTPQEGWKRITEAEWTDYLEELEYISFAEVPNLADNADKVSICFEYKGGSNQLSAGQSRC